MYVCLVTKLIRLLLHVLFLDKFAEVNKSCRFNYVSAYVAVSEVKQSLQNFYF